MPRIQRSAAGSGCPPALRAAEREGRGSASEMSGLRFFIRSPCPRVLPPTPCPKSHRKRPPSDSFIYYSMGDGGVCQFLDSPREMASPNFGERVKVRITDRSRSSGSNSEGGGRSLSPPPPRDGHRSRCHAVLSLVLNGTAQHLLISNPKYVPYSGRPGRPERSGPRPERERGLGRLRAPGIGLDQVARGAGRVFE